MKKITKHNQLNLKQSEVETFVIESRTHPIGLREQTYLVQIVKIIENANIKLQLCFVLN